MIWFDKDGTQVRLAVTIKVPFWDTRDVLFYWEAHDEVLAGVLADFLNRAFSVYESKVTKDNYNWGWADAKAKRKKETEF